MNGSCARISRTVRGLVGAAALAVVAFASADEAPASISGELRGIVAAPSMVQRLSRWGVAVNDVQHDIDAMTPDERRALLGVLTRPWPADTDYAAEDYQAQYLVTMSLMRESTLFASILSTGAGGLLR